MQDQPSVDEQNNGPRSCGFVAVCWGRVNWTVWLVVCQLNKLFNRGVPDECDWWIWKRKETKRTSFHSSQSVMPKFGTIVASLLKVFTVNLVYEQSIWPSRRDLLREKGRLDETPIFGKGGQQWGPRMALWSGGVVTFNRQLALIFRTLNAP